MPNYTEEWEVLKTKLANYQSVYDGPIPSLQKVNTIPDAPICGGGKLTLTLDGTHRQVNYHVTKPDFWKGTMGPARIFPKTSIVPARFCRLGLRIHNAASQPDGYQHEQDMAKAQVRSTYPLTDGILHVRSIALAQKDLVVFEMKAEGSGASVNVRLQADNEDNNFFIIEGIHDDKTVWLRKEHSSHVNVNTAAALRILGGKNVRATDADKIEANLSFTVEPSKPVMLVLSAGGGKDEYQHLADAITALDRVDINAIPELLKEHAAWWQNYWLKSWIDLTDPAIERYYYGALYVLGCSIDLDSRVAPGLAGAWITHTRPIWGGNYTMNYNGEAPFWSLFSANRGEMVLPYARVCVDYIPSGRRLAKELGTKGIVVPVMDANERLLAAIEELGGDVVNIHQFPMEQVGQVPAGSIFRSVLGDEHVITEGSSHLHKPAFSDICESINFLRRLALPKSINDRSLHTMREKLVKIGAKVVSHARYVPFQMAEVLVSRSLFYEILERIKRLKPVPTG